MVIGQNSSSKFRLLANSITWLIIKNKKKIHRITSKTHYWPSIYIETKHPHLVVAWRLTKINSIKLLQEIKNRLHKDKKEVLPESKVSIHHDSLFLPYLPCLPSIWSIGIGWLTKDTGPEQKKIHVLSYSIYSAYNFLRDFLTWLWLNYIKT